MDLLEVWVRPPFSHNDFSVQFKEKAEKPKHPPSSGSRRAVRFLLVDLWLSNFIHINKEAYHPACRSALGTQAGNHQSAAGGQTLREAL